MADLSSTNSTLNTSPTSTTRAAIEPASILVCDDSPAHDAEYVHRDDYDQLLALYLNLKLELAIEQAPIFRGDNNG